MRFWKKKVQEEDLRQCFERHNDTLGSNGQKSRGYSREGLAVITEQQHLWTTLRTGLGHSAELGQGEWLDKRHCGNGQRPEGDEGEGHEVKGRGNRGV